MEVGDDLKRYVRRKIGRLSHYASRHVRQSLHAEVKLLQGTKGKDMYSCEVILHLPGETFRVQETAQTYFAAIDLVEPKLQQHLTKYKELHTDPKLYRRIWARLRR